MDICLPRPRPRPRPANPASKKGSLFPEHSTGALQCRAVAFAPDGSFMLTASHHTIRLTTNMHHARTLCRFAAWHHHELTAALSTDAWRVLTDAIRQQQALQVQRQQQHQQDQLQRQQRQEQQALQLQQPAPAPLADPPAPPAVPYTHIDHFNNREGVSFLHSAIHRSGAQSEPPILRRIS